MIRRPPRSTQSRSSAASDVYKRQVCLQQVGFAGRGDRTHIRIRLLQFQQDGTRRLPVVQGTPAQRQDAGDDLLLLLQGLVFRFALTDMEGGEDAPEFTFHDLMLVCLLYTSDAADDLLCVD